MYQKRTPLMLQFVDYCQFWPKNVTHPVDSVKLTKTGVTFLSSFPGSGVDGTATEENSSWNVRFARLAAHLPSGQASVREPDRPKVSSQIDVERTRSTAVHEQAERNVARLCVAPAAGSTWIAS